MNLYRKYLFSANYLFSFSCFNVYLCLGNIFECFVALGRKTKGMQWFDFNEKKNKTDDPLFLFLARFGVPATAGKIGELLAT